MSENLKLATYTRMEQYTCTVGIWLSSKEGRGSEKANTGQHCSYSTGYL